MKSFNDKEIQAGQYFIMSSRSYGDSHIRVGKLIEVTEIKKKNYYGTEYTFNKIKVTLAIQGLKTIFDTKTGKWESGAKVKTYVTSINPKTCLIYKFSNLIIITDEEVISIFNKQYKDCLDNKKKIEL
jgi:hypothetical protein